MQQYNILVFHGSPRREANKDTLELVERLNQNTSQDYRVAFLEFAEPSLETVIESCAKTEPCHISLLPIFLSYGRHVANDIPMLATQAQARFEGLDINIHPVFGLSSAFHQALLAFLKHERLEESSL